jgi:hypothetical protein
MSITAQRFETISPTKGREQAQETFGEARDLSQPKKKEESIGCQGENGTSADEDRHRQEFPLFFPVNSSFTISTIVPFLFIRSSLENLISY